MLTTHHWLDNRSPVSEESERETSIRLIGLGPQCTSAPGIINNKVSPKIVLKITFKSVHTIKNKERYVYMYTCIQDVFTSIKRRTAGLLINSQSH